MFDVAVACPAGTFFNVISENCEDCQRGTYQPDEGQLTCLVCPNNTSTSRNSSKSIQQCQGMCLCVSSVCLSVCLSGCLSVRLSVCISLCRHMYLRLKNIRRYGCKSRTWSTTTSQCLAVS